MRATDGLGNTDLSPASYTWTVDTAAPLTTITSGPAHTASTTRARFEFTSTGQGSEFQCGLNASDWASCDSPATIAVGTDGGYQSPASYAWTVDRRAPEVNASLGNRSTTGRGNKYPTFKRSNLKKLSGTASDESGLRRIKVALRIDGKAAAAQDSCRFLSLYSGHRIAHPCKKPYTKVNGTTDWQLRLRNRVVDRLRTDEQYVLMVRATDLAGNSKYTRTRFSVVDG